jgi:putative DNA primase/helicase
VGGSRNWKDARLLISGADSLRQFYGYEDGGGDVFVPVPVAGFGGEGPAFTALGSKGTPLAQYENFMALCDHYGVQVRYNEMGKHEDVRLPGGMWGTSDRVRTLARDYIEDLCARHGLAAGKLDAWMRMRGEEYSYHPVREWVESREWDGMGRFEELLATVKVAPGQGGVWRTYLKRWLVQGIAALYEPKFHCRGVLTFTGDQGVGKTSWFKRLVPGNLEAFGEGLSLDPADKDSIIITLSRWVVELGEVDATFRKTDISRLKAFLTKDKDILRVPYGRAYDHWARRTVFGATVNDPQFLMDPTGNTRWWCVETESINWAHAVDMQQVWAEAKAWYEMGETWFLDTDETAELNRVNTQFEVPDPIMEAVLARFDFDAQERGNLMTTTKVLEAVGYQRPTKALVTNAGVVLKKLTGGNVAKRVDGVFGRYYEMPPFRDVVSGSFTVVEDVKKRA